MSRMRSLSPSVFLVSPAGQFRGRNGAGGGGGCRKWENGQIGFSSFSARSSGWVGGSDFRLRRMGEEGSVTLTLASFSPNFEEKEEKPSKSDFCDRERTEPNRERGWMAVMTNIPRRARNRTPTSDPHAHAKVVASSKTCKNWITKKIGESPPFAILPQRRE